MPSSLSRLLGAAAGALALASTLLGCSNPQSFIVLVVESATATPIANVAELRVVVSKGTTEMKTLTYGAGDLTFPSDADTNSGTLSVSFSGGETGDIRFDVTALDAQGCDIGEGTQTVTIKKGAVNEGIVPLGPGKGCTTDGGNRADAGDGGAFSGCDLVHPQCAIANQTCQVNCATEVNACAMAGTVAAGGSCQSGSDCAPGTQCYDYTGIGCATKICLRFCGGDADCASFGAGGAGPGSVCRDPICPGVTTASRICTFNCDPTAAAATASSSGCPVGLACLMPGTDAVDCACPEATRTGHEGDACTSSASCAPGFICNSKGGALSCRPVCRCDEVSGSCTAPSTDCPTAGTHCTPVTGQTIYGICQ